MTQDDDAVEREAAVLHEMELADIEWEREREWECAADIDRLENEAVIAGACEAELENEALRDEPVPSILAWQGRLSEEAEADSPLTEPGSSEAAT